MANKKIADYIDKKSEGTFNFGGRVPLSRKPLIEKKMKKDGIKKVQDLINAMVDKYLEE